MKSNKQSCFFSLCH